MSRNLFPEDIALVGKHINKKEHMSLRELSRRMKCSYFAAKRRLEAYAAEQGMKLDYVVIREGQRGPPSKAFFLE